MARRHWVIIFSLFLVVGISSTAWAAAAPPAVNGCWNVTGNVTASYGVPLIFKIDIIFQVLSLANEQFVFADDQSFSDTVIGLSGDWAPSGSKVVITLEKSVEDLLSKLPADKYQVNIISKTSSATLDKKKKNLTMTFKVDVDVEPLEDGAFDPGTITISGSFKGKRGTCPPAAAPTSLSAETGPAISDALAGAIANFLQR